MTRALLLVGSPRGRRSSSTSVGSYLLNLVQERGIETEALWLREQLTNEERTSQMLDAISGADIVILTAPLYDDCQPYLVTRTMELIADQEEMAGKRFIPIVNCGFPEAEHITAVAIPIYRKFASMVGFEWVGSLAIGGGEMIQGAQGKQLDEIGNTANDLKKQLGEIAEALASGTSHSDESIIAYPRFFLNPIMTKIMVWMNNRSWKSQAEKNGGKVDAKPYA